MTFTKKERKALKNGAENGMAAAGGATLVLNILGFCITITNPILLGIASCIGAIVCCCVCIQDMDEEDPEELQRREQEKMMKNQENAHAEIHKIGQRIENIEQKGFNPIRQFDVNPAADRKDEAKREVKHAANSPIFQSNFQTRQDQHTSKLFDEPRSMVMENKNEKMKRTATAKF